MSQTIEQLFGASAEDNGGTITINLSDYVDSSGTPLLDDPDTATPAQKASAWLSWLHRTQTPSTDSNGLITTDKTQAIVPQTSFTPKTFEVREDEAQVRNEFNFSIYTIDKDSFDPDHAV